jgi:hypothetical protein
VLLVLPSAGRAQNTGRVECARDDGYVYLYSSMTTLDVRTTVQCGEIVQIAGRYEGYFGVRNAKGETGYVPLAAVVLLKDQPGTGLPTTGTKAPARERTPYDDRSRPAPAPAEAGVTGFNLRKDTPVYVKLEKTISSTTTHVGDVVEFDVLRDVLVDGVVVIPKGAKAGGVIAEAEPKKRFGHSGRLSFNITSLRMANGEQAELRGYQQASGASSTSAADAVVPLSSGKDVTIPQDTEFTATVAGDVPLKRKTFENPAKDAAATPAGAAQSTQPRP